jgi:hypothetical protein
MAQLAPHHRFCACTTCLLRADSPFSRNQDFIDTQPVDERALASVSPRVPRQRTPVINIRRSNPVATMGVVFIIGVALLSYALLAS